MLELNSESCIFHYSTVPEEQKIQQIHFKCLLCENHHAKMRNAYPDLRDFYLLVQAGQATELEGPSAKCKCSPLVQKLLKLPRR